MPWRNWNDDEDLMRDLTDALRTEPYEAEVVAAGRSIGAWHTADPDRALAALLYDSSVDGLVAVRGPAPGAPRNLVFALGELRIEIELSDLGLEGQLIPPEPGRVWLLDATGPIAETVADEVGCFRFPAARRGPIRLECEAPDGRRLATEWIAA
jgi:pimeloyl-ACP methyl ester carboxylesterase